MNLDDPSKRPKHLDEDVRQPQCPHCKSCAIKHAFGGPCCVCGKRKYHG